MSVRGCCNRPACRSDSRIDDHNVDRAFRKIAIRALDEKRSLEHVVRSDIMCDIHYLRARRDSEDHAFHDPDERIGKAEVGGQGYNHFVSVGLVSVSAQDYETSLPR